MTSITTDRFDMEVSSPKKELSPHEISSSKKELSTHEISSSKQELSPHEIVERALRAKLEAKQQLSDASKRHSEVEKTLQHIERQEKANSRSETAMAVGKRVREGMDGPSATGKSPRLRSKRGEQEMEEDEDDRVPVADSLEVARGDKLTDMEGQRREHAETADSAATPAASGEEGASAPMDGLTGQDETKQSEEASAGGNVALVEGAPSSAEKDASDSQRGTTRPAPTPRMRLDDSTKQRSRKMFGVLMGTLQRARKVGGESLVSN